MPLLALLILAALQAIPTRCTAPRAWTAPRRWQSFRYVTLPAIRNTLLTVGILQVIVGLQVFDVLFTLTGGGPGRQTYVVAFAIVENAFTSLSFGYAAALVGRAVRPDPRACSAVLRRAPDPAQGHGEARRR